jgi:hypothetical protein
LFEQETQVAIYSGCGTTHLGSIYLNYDGLIEARDAGGVLLGTFKDEDGATDAIFDCWDAKLRSNGGGAHAIDEPSLQPSVNTPAPEPDRSQLETFVRVTPKFNHATASKFYNTIRPGACILGFKSGRRITTDEQFQALATEADGKHEHLFFHVATVKATWTSATTATKDQIQECSFLWGDCDAEKYIGNDPIEATKHYTHEGLRISQANIPR